MTSITRPANDPVANEALTSRHDDPVDSNIRSVDVPVDVPYSDFQKTHRKPYSVEYYGLSELWDDPEGGYTNEITTIEEYLQSKVDRGDLADTLTAIKEELKTLEKTNNLKKEERLPVKLGTLAAYVKFLMETDTVRYNMRKYGTRQSTG